MSTLNNNLLSFEYIPEKLEDIIGQKNLIEGDGIIKKMIDNHKIFSIIFYGYPGIGKSSLARVLCNELKVNYKLYNPTTSSKEELNKILHNFSLLNEISVIIIDEIHRMNKDKQDILLQYMEKNKIVVFATTTENPFFVINPAVRSRCQIIKLEQISKNDLREFISNLCLRNNINMNDDLINSIIEVTGGDLRRALNLISIIHSLYGNKNIEEKYLNKILGDSYSYLAKHGDELHDLKSALHKSIRGSDPNAAVYYLSRLIKSGDLKSISRRLIGCAYEDIGLANPGLPPRVYIATEAAEKVGFPEANNILSSIVIEMCLSPKSNSAYRAINDAIYDNDNGNIYKVPEHIRDRSYKSFSKFNKGEYLYPHNYKNSWVNQEYLPKELKNKKYYSPKMEDNLETKLVSNWEKLRGE